MQGLKRAFSGRLNIKTAIRITAALLSATVALFLLFAFYGNRQSVYSFFGASVPNTAEDYVCFLDVGEGDSALISSEGETLLIDTGTAEAASGICAKLRSMGVKKIDNLLLTHFHDDHTGAAALASRRFEIGRLILPDISTASDLQDISDVVYCRSRVLEYGAEVVTAHTGMKISVGKFTAEVIYYNPQAKSENDASIVVKLYTSAGDFLFMADTSQKAEKLMLEAGVDASCRVLKAGHHGAKTSSSKDFLNICSPQYSVISCGLGNMNSHPNSDTLERLKACSSEVYRTDTDGDVWFEIVGKTLKIGTANPHK